jgi:mevalonate kinase
LKTYHANGKLLITGEYLVLDGALSLAVPTRKGQSLSYQEEKSKSLLWESIDVNKEKWFEAEFSASNFNILETSNSNTAKFLQQLLRNANSISNSKKNISGCVKTFLEFPRDWGFGSSSTLISLVAQWFNLSPFELHFSVSNGSGYDIACAKANSAITYKLIDNQPTFKAAKWNPTFKESLFFVHLNTKQDSSKEVNKYKNNRNINSSLIEKIGAISENILAAQSIEEFKVLIETHEQLISDILKTSTIKEKLFPDFNGVVKSLGAWGGDFILVCGDKLAKEYFSKKGYPTQINFEKALIT